MFSGRLPQNSLRWWLILKRKNPVSLPCALSSFGFAHSKRGADRFSLHSRAGFCLHGDKHHCKWKETCETSLLVQCFIKTLFSHRAAEVPQFSFLTGGTKILYMLHSQKNKNNNNMFWVMIWKKERKERWLVFELGKKMVDCDLKKRKYWWVPRSSIEFESLQHQLDWGEPEIQFQAMIPSEKWF